MAIEPMKRITVLAHGSHQQELVDALRELACVHMDHLDSELAPPKEFSERETEELRRLNLRLAQTEFLLDFLQEYSGIKPGFLKTMLKDKYPMTLEEFDRADSRVDLEMLYAECHEFSRRLAELQEKMTALASEIDELDDWVTLQLPMEELRSNPTYSVDLVKLPEPEVDPLALALESEAPESALEVVSRDGTWASCLLLFHPSVTTLLGGVLAGFDVRHIELPSVPDEPYERLDQLKRELSTIERRREEALKRVSFLQEHVPALTVLHELVQDELKQVTVASEFGATNSSIAISGWVPQDSTAAAQEALAHVAEELVVEVTDPGESEAPPVSLKNAGWAKPFEILVGMYGTPNRMEYDPTVIVAISFAVFFGFCMGDAGYGLMLALAFTLMRRYLPLGIKAKDFLIVLTYGAGMSIVFGILTGSYFGIDSAELPAFLRRIAVLDPLNQTFLVMGVCILIGVIHMLAGTAIEFRDNWREKNYSDALIDQGLVFLLFAGGGITAALAAMNVVPSSVPLIVGGTAIVGMLALLGRSSKSIVGKAVNGLYETYGTVVGFISDAISYVRLFALGLATYIIGLVINTMAGLTRGIAPVIGILFMLLVLVVGHTFNVVINLLGAFVHPLRLEFVEFFGKFYDDGGEQFKPFGVDSKVVVIKDSKRA